MAVCGEGRRGWLCVVRAGEGGCATFQCLPFSSIVEEGAGARVCRCCR